MLSSKFPSRRGLVRSALAMAVAAATLPAAAQDADASAASATPKSLDTITVTAQFRTQDLQETPVAITAVTAETLEARGQVNVLDIAQGAPNVAIQAAPAGYGSNTASVYIRGIGQYDNSFTKEPGVGVYLDDVYQPTLLGSLFSLVDLERVEILRGPQGTLAGKNSIGGAIKLYTKKPDEHADGFFEVSAGNFNRLDLRAASNFTLKDDSVYLRLSAMSQQLDGYVTRYDYGCMNPGSGIVTGSTLSTDCKLGTEGGKDIKGARANLRWLASDRVEVNVAADFTVDRSEAVPAKLIASNNPLMQPYITDDPFANYATYANVSKGFVNPAQSHMDAYGISATVDFQISDSLSFKSVSSYRDIDSRFTSDPDASPMPQQNDHNNWLFTTKTQEFRLSGVAVDERLNYTVGTFWYEGEGHARGRIETPGIDVVQADITTSDSASLFAHADFAFTDRFSASLGLRYTEETKDQLYIRVDPVTGAPQSGVHLVSGSYEDEVIDTRVNLSYDLGNWMVYGTYATGYKGGGLNGRPYVPAQVAPFGPESVDSFELGVKGELMDRRVRVNAAVFQSKYDDIQVTIRNGYGGYPISAIPLNAGEAEISGAEFEMTARLAGGLTLDTSLSFLDFEYKNLPANALASGLTYDMVQNMVPDYKASLGLQYEFFWDRGSLIPRWDVDYQSEMFADAVNANTGIIPTRTLHNARLTWRPADADWELALFAKNITNKYYFMSYFDRISTYGTVGVPNRPREFGVSLKYRF